MNFITFPIYSTVQNVLFQFGLNNNLNFVLPNSGNQFYKKDKGPFKVEWLDMEKEKLPWHNNLKRKQNYDIFNSHCQWNASAIR